jgi:malate dehydrogenase
VTPTPAGEFHSLCLSSKGEYGVEAGLISSFPVVSDGATVKVVEGLPISDFSQAKIDASVKELQEERDTVSEALGL